MWKIFRGRFLRPKQNSCTLHSSSNFQTPTAFQHIALSPKHPPKRIKTVHLTFARTICATNCLNSSPEVKSGIEVLAEHEFMALTKSNFEDIDEENLLYSMLKNYPKSSVFEGDDIAKRITASQSASDVLNVFNNNKDLFSIKQSILALNALWSLQTNNSLHYRIRQNRQ